MWDNMDDKHPIDTLENARRKTRGDWVADAILIEAQLAIRNLTPSYRVGDFARITLTRLANEVHTLR